MLIAQECDLRGIVTMDIRPAEEMLVLVQGHPADHATETAPLTYLALDRHWDVARVGASAMRRVSHRDRSPDRFV